MKVVFSLATLAVVPWSTGVGRWELGRCFVAKLGPFVYFLPFWYSWGSSGEPQFGTRGGYFVMYYEPGRVSRSCDKKSKREEIGREPLFLKHRENREQERKRRRGLGCGSGWRFSA
ncbi:hypothetical protein BDP55DRAFT_76502 [Colletotrichum godetiae]|uniref:Uncharacterized protein n=1 Tax=Colletotrichum godetiae TaxID=1209918 RepID=A0AAJ0ASL6_9PEZI|nr:uncharacterized protein BDP55DRAFT_76502 [Colletotrichum godetiae]KAK1688070.1 hypothetical protein BDP55DRAFT_76502 [Colletotrichum godetiae]